MLTRVPWSSEAEHGLSLTFGDFGADAARQMVQSGQCELWRYKNHSWLVTELMPDECLFIWAYQGRDACEMLQAMQKIARANGVKAIRFNTEHRGLGRMFQSFAPRLTFDDGRVRQYEVAV